MKKIRKMSDIFGYSNVESTENYYISSLNETLKSASLTVLLNTNK